MTKQEKIDFYERVQLKMQCTVSAMSSCGVEGIKIDRKRLAELKDHIKILYYLLDEVRKDD